jgi:hypothetical protein
MSIKLTNLIFMTLLGVVVGALFAPACGIDCYKLSAAIGGGIGLLIGCLLNRKAPPTTPRDNAPAKDPLVE